MWPVNVLLASVTPLVPREKELGASVGATLCGAGRHQEILQSLSAAPGADFYQLASAESEGKLS